MHGFAPKFREHNVWHVEPNLICALYKRIRKLIMSKRITSVILSTTTVLWLSGAAAFVPTVTVAATVEELQAQISALLAQITALQAQLSTAGGTTGAVCGYTFAVNLKQGDTATDVKNLQIVLNSDAATKVALTGVGSSGNETTYFGSLTKAAAIKFQEKYAADILSPLGLTAGTGNVAAATRAKLNALFGTCGTIPTPTPTPIGTLPTPTPVIPSGSGLTVTAGVQPTASLIPLNAARVPFTVVRFTASYDGDVTVNSLTVERTGLADDDALDSIALLDEASLQIGLSKTLNSVHQVILNEPFTVKAGQTRTMTIAANAPTSGSTNAGQVPFLSLVSVNTSAVVNGILPITGTGHTVNATLAIGTLVSPTAGTLDPGATSGTDREKEVGTTG